ncbi:MAG: LysR family transcriptional regulator [Alphaproteobacteria bacterium]|nr:LysR family transcriptional regulator [Alphaproteobacteria bacterium]
MLGLETSPYFRDLDWEKLKAFYYVAKVGNISHAAQFLKVNQSSFSRSITALEKHLGYPLFIRTRNGVTLNRTGKELFAIVENIFVGMKGFTSRTYGITNQRQNRKIRIATNPAIASYILNELILDYNKDHPDLVFEIMGVDQAVDVILYDVDIAIQPHNPKMDSVNNQVIQEPFFTLEKKLYASPQYLETYGEPITIDDLRYHHFIISSTTEACPFGGVWGNLEPKVESENECSPVFVSNSLECLIEAAKQGKGIICAYDKITILKNSALKNILPDVTIQKCQEYFAYPAYLKEDQDIMNIKKYLKIRMDKVD